MVQGFHRCFCPQGDGITHTSGYFLGSVHAEGTHDANDVLRQHQISRATCSSHPRSYDDCLPEGHSWGLDVNILSSASFGECSSEQHHASICQPFRGERPTLRDPRMRLRIPLQARHSEGIRGRKPEDPCAQGGAFEQCLWIGSFICQPNRASRFHISAKSSYVLPQHAPYQHG